MRDDPLLHALADARARTHELTRDLPDAPGAFEDAHVRWVLGHVARRQEAWILERGRGLPPLRDDAEAIWGGPAGARLPGRLITLAYAQAVLSRALEQVCRPYHDLAVCHEDGHGERLAWWRDAWAMPEPRFAARTAITRLSAVGAWTGDVDVPGGSYWLGALPGTHELVLDDETWAHRVEVAPFRIARAPVTNEEYERFVEAGGYADRRWWSEEGWSWRTSVDARHPLGWVRVNGGWCCMRWDRLEALPSHHPVVRVSHHEAEAYCRWAGRRLPTEAEWELAACSFDKRPWPWGDSPPAHARANLDARVGCTVDVAAHAEGDSPYGCRQMVGNVWEWTGSDFALYPGARAPALSAERTARALATRHVVLRGGSWATRARSIRATWREPQPPGRRDLFAGFRTCALV